MRFRLVLVLWSSHRFNIAEMALKTGFKEVVPLNKVIDTI